MPPAPVLAPRVVLINLGEELPMPAKARGFDASLAKPFPLTALIDKIEEIERDWQ